MEKFRSIAQVPGTAAAGVVDLYQIARRMMDVYARSAGRSNLTIAIKDIDVIPHIAISGHELEQVFFVLIQNAIDAADPDKKQNLTISCNVGVDVTSDQLRSDYDAVVLSVGSTLPRDLPVEGRDLDGVPASGHSRC